jgi:7-carboxy-7-deazaguanine synthase
LKTSLDITSVNASVELPIMEDFYTIQGEGSYSGRAAYFIRIAGCDVGCVWCDVKDSWDKEKHPLLSIETLVEKVCSTPTDFVVITGGEPALYDLNALVDALHEKNMEVAIETSGCYPLKGAIDWYCFSPKKFKKPCSDAFDKANELKVIIAHPSDFEWAEGHRALLKKDAQLFLQPEWSKEERLLPLIIEYVKQNPRWKVSLQTHKYMQIP